jgi:hypothetical protein
MQDRGGQDVGLVRVWPDAGALVEPVAVERRLIAASSAEASS